MYAGKYGMEINSIKLNMNQTASWEKGKSKFIETPL